MFQPRKAIIFLLYFQFLFSFCFILLLHLAKVGHFCCFVYFVFILTCFTAFHMFSSIGTVVVCGMWSK